MHKKPLVLVLGKNGLLGNAIIQKSTQWPYQILGWGREDLDVSDKEAVFQKIINLKPDVVINCTAMTNVDACEDDPSQTNIVNGLAPGYIAQATSQINAKFIQISTDYIFNGQNPEGYLESDAPGPLNEYGRSKLLGEQETIKHNPKHFIIRVSWLYGSDHKHIPNRKDFIATILDWAKTKTDLSILNDQVGKITNAQDVASTIKDFVESDDYGIYHLCNEGELTRYELAKTTFELLNRPEIKVTPATIEDLNIKWRAQRPKFSSLINTKTKKLPDWKTSLSQYLQKEYGQQ